MIKKLPSCYKENIFSELTNKNAILTAGDNKIGYNCLTVSWGGIGVLWGRDVAYVFVRKSRHTYSFLERSENVTLSFLDEQYKDSVQYIGTHSGKTEDKVKAAKLSFTYDPDYGGAYITQCSYCFKMKKLYALDIPYENLPKEIQKKYYPTLDIHTMFVCEIKQFLATEDYYAIH